jgi:hypothetical protein
MTSDHVKPTRRDLKKAERLFLANEPRDLFYRVASELVELAMTGATSITVAEALAVLLETWNQSYYRFRPELRLSLPEHLDGLLRASAVTIKGLRNRDIETLDPGDLHEIGEVFEGFDAVLGPVGAAKALHLLAPRFFPLWDSAIARAYGLGSASKGRNGRRYLRFMELVQMECRQLGDGSTTGHHLLKSLDQLNYCRYTKGWL